MTGTKEIKTLQDFADGSDLRLDKTPWGALLVGTAGAMEAIVVVKDVLGGISYAWYESVTLDFRPGTTPPSKVGTCLHDMYWLIVEDDSQLDRPGLRRSGQHDAGTQAGRRERSGRHRAPVHLRRLEPDGQGRKTRLGTRRSGGPACTASDLKIH